ncbi:U3-containing 90S pre-ribosomal complex subunit-domain containing protein [Mycotypha africana]|uniref:U3-containing 90S pre-ribosomal complex subunit-domain containing protein n=1 Tax=Mycotypha africana TaxID=64632 RepID=UPI002300B9D9|nr:U3-containing 90S pre-ribosomal complex subunit-domain containing protein [Mycotypha africana]KAI8973623.1 U3-containing 90S pre-ribosomal complex subunit-domain containing protein [Mycotypha africana]
MSEVSKDEKKQQQPVSADALEDDFYMEDAVIDSNDEAALSDTNDDIDQPADMSVNGLKRKREETIEETQNTQGNEKKKKKKKNNKKKKQLNPFDIINIWTENTTVQAEYLADRQKIALPNLSSVELDEQSIPVDHLVNNENFKQEHVLDALSNYIKFGVAGHKKLGKKPTVKASPVALVITHSAVRAVDLVRALKDFSSTAKVAKLFAKHFKIEEQIDFLGREAIHIGVGTPNRLLTLVEQGYLKLDALELVVIDTERNAKRFNIFDLQEVRTDLFNFLGTNITPLFKKENSKLKIGLF